MTRAFEHSSCKKTLDLFWELRSNQNTIDVQPYIRFNKHRVDAIRYIFKMRAGIDGSK